MGGSSTTIEAPRIGSLQINSSAYGLVIPIVRGTTRINGNVLWFGDFTAIKHEKSSGGKGGGGVTNVTYTYEAAIMMALCNGPINGVGKVWKNKEKTDIAHINTGGGGVIKDIVNPPAEVVLVSGTPGQAVWSHLTAHHPQQAIGYTGLAYIASTKMQLSADAGVPQLSFEILGPTAPGQLDDNPKEIIVDFLSNPIYGAEFPLAKIGNLTDFGNWCTAAGLFLSPAFQEQKEAREWLDEIAQCTNSQYVWSGGTLKLIPYADAVTTGNGVTYTPGLTPVYDLTDDDFQASGDEDPVSCSRITTADAYNHVQVEFLNRARDYNVEIAEAKDQADIEAKGLRTKDPIKLHMICNPSTARTVAQMILQRGLYIRNIYGFRLTWKHCLLEPMDLVTITDAALGLNQAPVRIIEIEEDDEGMLAVRAEECPFGVNSTAIYPHQDTDGYLPNYQVSPGDANTPVIFEPPFRLTDNSLEIWLGTSGGELWGGCEVWVSRDNATYAKAGVIRGGARHGTLVNQLPSGSAVDTVNTLRVQMADFYNNQLLAASQTEANELRTLMWVDGELIAYRDAVLVSAGVYNLSHLMRGAHNSVIGAHNAGSKFARIDPDTFFRYQFLPTDIGKTIYIKLVSFNIYNVATQNIADISPHTYTITGYARQRLPVDITAPAVPTVTTSTNNTYPYTGHLIVSWTAVSGISKYRVRYRKSGDTQWKESPVASGTTWKSPELLSGDTYEIAVASEDEHGYLSTWTVGTQTAIPYDATAPATPGVITITPGIGFLGIQWPRNTDVDIAGYELQIAPDNAGAPGTWNTVYTGPDNAHTYRGTTGATYWARVRAFDRYPGTPKYSSYNGQTAASVDYVKALDASNVPTGYNLVINSDFDAGTLDGWVYSGSTPVASAIIVATAPKSGKYAFRNSNGGARIESSRRIPVVRDRVVILECYARTVATGTGNGVVAGLRFYDSAGAVVSGGDVIMLNYASPPSDFTYYSVVVGPGQAAGFPAAATHMQVVVHINPNSGTGEWQVQGVRLREVIEAAYIKNLAVTDAHILNVGAGKIVSGSVTSQVITLALTEGAGDVAIKAGKSDFGDNTSGFIIGVDDSDSNLPKVEIGDANNYLKYCPGTGLQIAGAITVRAGSSGYGNLTDKPTNLSSINSTEGSKLAGIAAGATVGATLGSNLYRGDNGALVTTITAEGVYTGTLTAEQVNAVAINADSITTGTLTGRTIRTSASGTRVQIDGANNTMVFYGNRGDGVIEQAVYIGDRLVQIGSSSYQNTALKVYSNKTYSIRAYAYNPNKNEQPPCIEAYSESSYTGAAIFAGNTTTANGRGVITSAQMTGGIGCYSYGGAWDFYAAGYGSNYGPFTGAHEGLVLKGFTADIGDILVDVKCVEKANISNTICENALSTTMKQANIIGIYVSHCSDWTKSPPSALWDKELMLPNPRIVELCEIYDVVNFNAIGEGMINVCRDGGNIQAGDYICSSSRPGKGMKQDDDLLHNYTVAKAREGCVWTDEEDDIRLIACTYHCG